jgi:hypothetical protein
MCAQIDLRGTTDAAAQTKDDQKEDELVVRGLWLLWEFGRSGAVPSNTKCRVSLSSLAHDNPTACF